MIRLTLARGVQLETGRDCRGEPRLVRLDAAQGFPASVERWVQSLGPWQTFGPAFGWVDVPGRFRMYGIRNHTLRIVFRQKAAGTEAQSLLMQLGKLLEQAGWPGAMPLPEPLQKEFALWDNEVTTS